MIRDLKNVYRCRTGRNRYSRGITFFKAVFLIFLTTGVSAQYRALEFKIDFFYNQGAFEKARLVSDSAAPLILKELGENSLLYGEFVSDYRGLVYDKCGDYKKAEEFYKKGMEIIARASGETIYSYIEACSNLGTMYQTIGLYGPAMKYTVRARELLQQSGKTRSEAYASSTNTLANIYSSIGPVSLAEAYYDSTLLLIRYLSKQNPFIVLRNFEVYNNYAALYNRIGNYEKANYYFRLSESMGLSNPLIPRESFNTLLTNYSTNLCDNNQFEEAKQKLLLVKNYISKQPGKNKKLSLTVANNLIEILRAGEKNDSCRMLAESLLTQSWITSPQYHIEYYTLLLNYAKTLMQVQKWTMADSILSTVVKMNEADGFTDVQVRSKGLYFRAWLYLSTARYDEAVKIADTLYTYLEKVLLDNFDILSETDRYSQLSFIYQCVMIEPAAFFGKGMKDTALLNKIYSRFSYWKSLLLEKQSRMITLMQEGTGNSIQWYREWKNNRQFLFEQFKLPASRRSNITDSVAVATELLEARFSKDNMKKRENAGNAAKELTPRLRKDECLLEFLRFASSGPFSGNHTIHYGVFVTTAAAEKPVWVYLCTENQLKNILTENKNTPFYISSMPRLFVDPRLKKKGKKYPDELLYRLLWKPISAYLKKSKVIYCVGDGLLTQIPFHALPLANSHFLADSFSFRYLLSKKFIAAESELTARDQRLEIWGNIAYSTSQAGKHRLSTAKLWPALPGSITETNGIKKIVNHNFPVRTFERGNATEKNFRQQADTGSASILHISTHGFFTTRSLFIANNRRNSGSPFLNMENPLFNCGLVFAGANNLPDSTAGSADDGILTGYEIAALPLHQTKLVVLSACETGLGNIWHSESIFGLQRAFKLSGAGKIIMSLWKVPDLQTSELMLSFYTYLVKGRSPEMSLELAQKKIRQKYPSPFNWAGFILLR